MILHGSEKNHLSERHHLAEDEPDVDHLDVRGGGQALHLADEDGGHHQHGGQIHAQGCLKEEGLEEGGGKGDRRQKKCGEEGGHYLACNFPLHGHNHTYSSLVIFEQLLSESPINYAENVHVLGLTHVQLVIHEIHSCHVQCTNSDVDRAGLIDSLEEVMLDLPVYRRDRQTICIGTERCEYRPDS